MRRLAKSRYTVFRCRTAPAGLALTALVLAGCEGRNPLGGLFQPDPPAIAAPPDRLADANGVIRYDDFAVIVARDGDTVSSMAARVGLQDVVLARYNGLPLSYILRPGDRLALPDGAQVAAVEQGWTPEIVTGVLDALPDGGAQLPPRDAPGTVPLRHNVAPGETAFSIARLYGVSVTALASWNGLGSDLSVSPGRSLLIPNRTAPDAPADTDSEPGAQTAIEPPPSAVEPLPEDTEVVEIPDGPNLGALRSETRTGPQMQAPVAGTIVKGFSAAPGRSRNDGVDYQTAAGAEVRAAAAGEVALVSPSVGLGQIVLVRHPDNIITVYGRLADDVRVSKGDPVSAGQVIGTVEAGDPPILHFEVRRGTEAIDPAPFL